MESQSKEENAVLEKLLTVRQVQEFLPLSRKSLYALARDGKIGYLKTNDRGTRGGLLFFRESDLLAWVKAHSVDLQTARLG